MVIVDLATATICFLNSCYPALVGPDTPVGEFPMIQRMTQQAGYGGDVIQFKETKDAWYGVHRVWTMVPKERRAERLNSGDVKQRQTITHGCINVTQEVYEKLRDCCSNDTLSIHR